MDTALTVNCLWMSSSWASGIYTPRQLNSATWTGVLTASLYHQLYFALFEGTDEDLISAAMLTSRELQEVSPALLSAGQEPEIAVDVQVIPVTGWSTHFSQGKTVPADPGSVVARAWSETPAVGAADSYCIWLVAVNSGHHWTASHGSGAVIGQLVNLTLTSPHLDRFGMPFTHGNWQFSASTPFQAAPDRSVPILGTGDTRFIVDFIPAGETVVYKLGCGIAPNDPLPLADRVPTGNCGLLNPDFEHYAIAGKPLGWEFGYSTSTRDGRSAMLLDTRNPKHGRHALRVTVPTATPLFFPLSTSFFSQGPRIKPAAQYNISFWARAAARTGSMRVELLQCGGGITTAEDRCTTPAVVSAVLTEDWRQVSVAQLVSKASAPNVYLRAVGAGQLFLDHVQVSGC